MSQPHAAPPNEINDAWRGWIAENLILGAQPQALLGVMIQSGIAEHSARVELDAAMRSPTCAARRACTTAWPSATGCWASNRA
jgi:hypothetical protein